MMMRPLKKVFTAIHMFGSPGPGKLDGIYSYLAGRSDWQMQLIRTQAEFTRECVEEALENGVDGFIVSLHNDSGATERILESGVPSVMMDMDYILPRSDRPNAGFVSCDNFDIGRTGAKFLLKRGYRRFVYLHSDNRVFWSRQRAEGFCSELAANGFECTVIEAQTGGDRKISPEELIAPYEPVAVFAASDTLASTFIGRCRAQDIEIPERISVLGVNNDVQMCLNSVPALSSIRPDFESIGRRAAAILDKMMHGEKPPVHEFIPHLETVERASTIPASAGIALVNRAMDIISSLPVEKLTVKNVIGELNVSRQLADLRFRQVRGETVCETLLKRRLGEVKRRLLSTTETIDAVSVGCGWENPISLKNLFKRRFGISMRDFRESARRHNGEGKNDKQKRVATVRGMSRGTSRRGGR